MASVVSTGLNRSSHEAHADCRRLANQLAKFKMLRGALGERSWTSSWPGGTIGRRHRADFAPFGHNHPPMPTAAAAPRSCATMNAGTPVGAMPANVSERERAIVTAGLANEVDAVNQ
jgi:hypothetical protein